MASRSARTAAKCAWHASQSESPILGASCEQRPRPLALDVEDAQRARPQLLPRLLVQLVLVLLEPGGQPLDVRGPAVAAADRVQLQPVGRDPEPAEQRVVELDDLGVDRRIVRADRLDRELPVLAIAAAAGRAVPVHRPDRVELLRLRLAVQPVLDVGAADRRRPLRAQRQRPVGAVGERVHLLLDDVGALRRTCAGRGRCPRRPGVWIGR